MSTKSKVYVFLAFFAGIFLTFNVFFASYRYNMLVPSDEGGGNRIIVNSFDASGAPCPTLNCDEQLKRKQSTIDKLNEKLKEKDVILPPEVPPQELPQEVELPDFNLLGLDANVRSTVEKIGDDKDKILPWKEYHKVYKDFVKKIDKEYLPQDFIIAIVTANRPQYLGATIRSLQQVLYWNPNNTIIYQHGDDKRINMISKSYNIRQVKNPVLRNFQGKDIEEGAEHIAIHYRFVLDHVFNSNPNAKHFIIVEDDMIFAPDILLYFSQLAPLMERDPSIYSISAYNDNGFKGRVRYDNIVYRTDFFIGLGWLVSRRLWDNEWKMSWPRTHWDHFLRNPMNRRDRQTLYPEISRIYHSGYKGTHSTVALYEKYFRDIELNGNGYVPLGISKKDFQEEKKKYKFANLDKMKDETTLEYLIESEYRNFFIHLISPSNPDVVYLTSLNDVENYKDKHLVIPYDAQYLINRAWMHISEYFDVWHTVPVRSEYLGVTPFLWMNNNIVYMMATYSQIYEQYPMIYPNSQRPALVSIDDFQVEPPWLLPKSESVLSISTAERGQSCSTLCQERFGDSSKCDLFKIGELNSCRYLKKYFNCQSCGGNIGHDQPAYDAEEDRCLYNSGSRQYMTTCEGSHSKTQRLCACFDPKTVVTFHEEWESMIAQSQKQGKNPSNLIKN